MEALINYLIESSLVLGVLTIFYSFLLRQEHVFHFNRIYLITSLIISTIIPFVNLTSFIFAINQSNELSVVLNGVDVYARQAKELVVPVVLQYQLFIWLYAIGMLFLFGRLFLGFGRLGGLSKQANWINYRGYKVAHLPGQFNPFSFFRLIFVNPQLYSEKDLDKIMDHEIAHIQLKHSIDVMLVEILLIMQWFNPFAWIIRALLKELHEFQADKEVIDKGVSLGQYKTLLLCQAVGNKLLPVNNFSQSITKRRFKMMSNNLKNKKSIYKIATSVMLLIAVVIFFSCESLENDADEDIKSIEKEGKEYNQMIITNSETGEVDTVTILSEESDEHANVISQMNQSKEPVFNIVEEMPKYPGGDLELRKFVAKTVVYPQEAKEKEIEGRVYVSFVVNKEGNVEKAKIARGVHQLLDEEALRVIRSMPRWIPGKQRGRFVNVNYTIHINFMFNNSKTKK